VDKTTVPYVKKNSFKVKSSTSNLVKQEWLSYFSCLNLKIWTWFIITMNKTSFATLVCIQLKLCNIWTLSTLLLSHPVACPLFWHGEISFPLPFTILMDWWVDFIQWWKQNSKFVWLLESDTIYVILHCLCCFPSKSQSNDYLVCYCVLKYLSIVQAPFSHLSPHVLRTIVAAVLNTHCQTSSSGLWYHVVL
jgi:hypothetical protein